MDTENCLCNSAYCFLEQNLCLKTIKTSLMSQFPVQAARKVDVSSLCTVGYIEPNALLNSLVFLKNEKKQ